jgi:hypothetical protein
MARAGWVKPESDQRLSDHISIGVLTRVFPPELVDKILDETDRVQQRSRLLPARVVVYYVLGLALFSQCSYEEVMRMLVEGLSWAEGWTRPWSVPTKAALFKARARLGSEPLIELFKAVAVPLGLVTTRGAFYRSWRLMAIDGTTLDLADTPANSEHFGRPGSGRGEGIAAFPQLRVVGLGECGTHALVDVAVGACHDSEPSLATELFSSLHPDMLLLADRGFYGFERFREAAGSGAALCWRVRKDLVLPVTERLFDGSYHSMIYPRADRPHGGTAVRVIEYGLKDPGRTENDTVYRLVTTILDPEAAPARELAAHYAQRWEFESTLDELKSHQRGPRIVLRSKMPDGVIQEVYAYFCVHYAIRWLMHQVATESDTDPDRLSFTRTLRVARRTTASHPGFSP